jgi:hypothetical protein
MVIKLKSFGLLWSPSKLDARVAQLLERRRKDLMILESRVEIPLWDVSAGPSDETT